MLQIIQRRKFDPKEDFSQNPYIATNAVKALREMQRISELNGNSEMTLKEINAEITAARRDMDAKKAAADKALKALKILNDLSALNGNSEMTLEEINAEIYAARREMETQRLS